MAKLYHCKWCGENHNYPAASRYCDKNPDAEANRAAHKDKMKKTFVDNDIQAKINVGKKKHAKKISETSSRTLTKNRLAHPEKFDQKGENNNMYGKKTSLKQKMTTVKLRRAWLDRNQDKFLEKKLEQFNIPRPVKVNTFDHEFFNIQKPDSSGFYDANDGYNDEFNPFG